jgi:hypothetical protein
MVRGEAADYSIDYDLAQVTFSNRRAISSASRITVDYQFSVNRYRRNFAGFDGRWDHGGLWAATRVLTETDDRGAPLEFAFDDAELAALRLAGDSSDVAIGPGVTPGVGDYDTVRVNNVVHFAFVGPDSGSFAVTFARIGAGRGDYADSAFVGGRVAYRFVGTGAGAFVIGTALPLPESHLPWSMSAGARAGRWRSRGRGRCRGSISTRSRAWTTVTTSVVPGARRSR